MMRTASSRLKVLMATSPMSATFSESKGAAPVAMLYGRIITDSARISRGPKRVPARSEVPMSSGTPTKAASRPAGVGTWGRRIMVAMPPKRGISLPPSGWWRILSTGLASSLFYLWGLRRGNECRRNRVGPILRNVVGGKNRYGQILSSDFSKLRAGVKDRLWPCESGIARSGDHSRASPAPASVGARLPAIGCTAVMIAVATLFMKERQ
ncbi:hypothetical protein EMIT0196P_110052 [Pseudomonas chlororaphis]